MPYIIESNLNVRKVDVEKNDGEFAIISFNDSDSRLMVRTGRLYATREEAEKHLPYKKYRSCSISGRTGMTPWNYQH